jgi:hypothetical protein
MIAWVILASIQPVPLSRPVRQADIHQVERIDLPTEACPASLALASPDPPPRPA